VDRPGNRTPISSVQARHLPVGRAAHVLSEVRLGIEPSLPPYHGGVQPQHLQTEVFSHRSDPGWNRTITFLVVTQAPLPLDHGIGFAKWRVRESHPAGGAYETLLGAGPPAKEFRIPDLGLRISNLSAPGRS
jgi:hypothetical protein